MTTAVSAAQSMSLYLASNPEVKYILFGGKGGLGKTTLSAATSYWLAKQGKKVCVFSTGPPASLTDILDREIFWQGAVEITKNLFALEVEAGNSILEYQT